MWAIARAMSESSRGSPVGLTVSSSATVFTPYTHEAERTAANFCA
jgi:hypothetical protein